MTTTTRQHVTRKMVAEAITSYTVGIRAKGTVGAVVTAVANGDGYDIVSEIIDNGIDNGIWPSPADFSEEEFDDLNGEMFDKVARALPIAAAAWRGML